MTDAPDDDPPDVPAAEWAQAQAFLDALPLRASDDPDAPSAYAGQRLPWPQQETP